MIPQIDYSFIYRLYDTISVPIESDDESEDISQFEDKDIEGK